MSKSCECGWPKKRGRTSGRDEMGDDTLLVVRVDVVGEVEVKLEGRDSVRFELEHEL